MKKVLFTLLAFALSVAACYAQKGNNQIGIGGEINFPLGNGYNDIYNPGIGGNLKGLYGIGDAGQLTLTAGYNSFSGKSSSQFGDQTLSLIPIQAGYRYNLKSGLYGEGQAGLGILTTKVTGYSASQTNFAGAINVGYLFKGFDIGVKYYTEFDVFSSFAVRLAYNIPLGDKK
ncbi:MAG: hypothetical protein JSU01_21270 [Bacteroidetes bacterium]|nr:hypothetical protein [Bacteroidota bacterium]